MKRKIMTLTLALLLGLCIGMLLAFWLTCYRRSGLRFPRVSVEAIGGRQVLVMFVDEHPPWAHSHFYDVAFDYHSKTIDVTEYYVPLHPFSPHVWSRPPVVIQAGVLPGNYALRCWNGQQYVEAGRLTVGENGNIDWRAQDAETTGERH